MKFIKQIKNCTGCSRRRAKIKNALNIFVPSKNIYFPQPKWGFPKWQRGSVSVTAFVNAAQQGVGPALDTTVTVGNVIYCVDGTADESSIFGYNAATNDYHNDASYGSIGDDTWVDGGSTTRTIAAMWYTGVGVGTCLGDGDDLGLSVEGTSISNTNTTFVSIDYDGTNYTRSSATYTASVNGGTHWRWLNISPNGPTTGTVDLLVNI